MARDVTPDPAPATIGSITVLGALQANVGLADRIKQGRRSQTIGISTMNTDLVAARSRALVHARAGILDQGNSLHPVSALRPVSCRAR